MDLALPTPSLPQQISVAKRINFFLKKKLSSVIFSCNEQDRFWKRKRKHAFLVSASMSFTRSRVHKRFIDSDIGRMDIILFTITSNSSRSFLVLGVTRNADTALNVSTSLSSG